MRKTEFHRRATAYLRRMPARRRDQMLETIAAVAATDDVSTHPGVRALRGRDGYSRLRVGSYRAIFELQEDGSVDIMYVDWIGPRGDAYR